MLNGLNDITAGIRMVSSGALIVCLAAGCSGHVLTVGDATGGTSSGGAANTLTGGSNNASGGAATGGSDAVIAPGGSGNATGGTDGMAAACPLCTRHSETPSRICNRGTGVTSTSVVGVAGGEVTLGGTPATLGVSVGLRIPPNALSQDTEISITELAEATPATLLDYSPIYRIDPPGLTFDDAVELRVPWTYSYGNGLILFVPGLFRADSAAGPYTQLPEDYMNAGFNQATLPQTGYVIVGYPRAEAHSACP